MSKMFEKYFLFFSVLILSACLIACVHLSLGKILLSKQELTLCPHCLKSMFGILAQLRHNNLCYIPLYIPTVSHLSLSYSLTILLTSD